MNEAQRGSSKVGKEADVKAAGGISVRHALQGEGRLYRSASANADTSLNALRLNLARP